MHQRVRDERGAVAVVTAALLTVILGVAAFTVDIGMQRVVRRDMQALADVVALDVSRHLDGFTTSDILLGSSAFREEVKASATRNSTTTAGDTPTLMVEVGHWADGAFTPHGSVTYDVAPASLVSAASGSTTAQVPNAVSVTSRASVGFGFARVLGVSSGGAARTALASRDVPGVCFSVGSNLLDLDTADNALLQALNSFLGIDLLDLSTSVLGPNGIASVTGASVPLIDLAAALDVGTVDGLITTTDPISVGELLTATATVLSDQGTLAGADAALLFGALAATPSLATPTLLLSDVLAIAPGGGTALQADLHVLDLLNALVLVAGENAVGLSAPLNLPSIGPVQADVEIIEIPKIACGRPGQGVTAESAQIRVSVTSALPAGGVVSDLVTALDNTLAAVFGALPVGFATSQERLKSNSLSATVTIEATSAESKATLESLPCPDVGQSGQATFAVESSLATVGVAVDVGYTLQRRTRTPLLNIFGLHIGYTAWSGWSDVNPPVSERVVGLDVGLGDDAPYPQTLVFPAPPEDPTASATRNTPLALDLDLTLSQENALTGLLGALATPVLDTLVDPLLATLNAGLLPALDDTLGSLGVELGNTTVAAVGGQSCGPRLIG